MKTDAMYVMIVNKDEATHILVRKYMYSTGSHKSHLQTTASPHLQP